MSPGGHGRRRENAGRRDVHAGPRRVVRALAAPSAAVKRPAPDPVTLIVMDVPEIDYRAELPPHRQIAAWILARIESGDLQPGQPAPSEKELTDMFGVARTTARRAIASLRDQGAVRTVAGRGSYVAEKA